MSLVLCIYYSFFFSLFLSFGVIENIFLFAFVLGSGIYIYIHSRLSKTRRKIYLRRLSFLPKRKIECLDEFIIRNMGICWDRMWLKNQINSLKSIDPNQWEVLEKNKGLLSISSTSYNEKIYIYSHAKKTYY